ncbi:MAG: DUF805 domain-containing protein [Elusimicrobiaceae bacterium]|nr:DUF805 domain-containing protein [Elusimicrobiaceae bacterium]
MKTYFLDVITKHYIDFSGRATRKQFWLFVLFAFIVSLLLGIVCSFLGDAGKIIPEIYSLAMILPGLGIQARRLRDGGFTPWLLLLNLIPVIGWLILLILYVLPSKN